MQERISVGVLGATGMVGQRFVTLLENHPWFKVDCVAASPQSAGKTYEDAVSGRWYMEQGIPPSVGEMRVLSVEDDLLEISKSVRVVFCALDMDKDRIRKLEEEYAARGVAVVSNNSAHRWTPDVPMIIPEINPHHAEVIVFQRQQRRWDKGLITVKPNCSLQSFLPPVYALRDFGPNELSVVTFQAVSGAGKTLETWLEMDDNVIPYIKGEEEKTTEEPRKILGRVEDGIIVPISEDELQISATCVRVPVSDGHMAAVGVIFERKPKRVEVIDAWQNYPNPIAELNLPSAPKQFIIYREEDDRPQTRLDRMAGNGMSVTLGRLREDTIFDWEFVGLSHNTIRGAAGGAILTAELLVVQGYI